MPTIVLTSLIVLGINIAWFLLISEKELSDGHKLCYNISGYFTFIVFWSQAMYASDLQGFFGVSLFYVLVLKMTGQVRISVGIAITILGELIRLQLS